jgi:hypothetical protein
MPGGEVNRVTAAVQKQKNARTELEAGPGDKMELHP